MAPSCTDGVNALAGSCVFCEIVEGRRKAAILHEDSEVLAFRDILPQAPTHILIVPKTHFRSASAVTDPAVWGKLMAVAGRLVSELGLEEEGYRLVVNNGPQAGQTIPHLHVHLLAGRAFRWPPG
ncbi:MAG: histidine triad nucleotide-binding protein [Synergistales bacterium]